MCIRDRGKNIGGWRVRWQDKTEIGEWVGELWHFVLLDLNTRGVGELIWNKPSYCKDNLRMRNCEECRDRPKSLNTSQSQNLLKFPDQRLKRRTLKRKMISGDCCVTFRVKWTIHSITKKKWPIAEARPADSGSYRLTKQESAGRFLGSIRTVSYTHLTLPTIYSV